MSDTHTGDTGAVGFEGVTPILRVRSVAESVAYYVQTLGFTLDFHEGPLASVCRDRCCIFLREGDQGHPGNWVWVGVEDANALFEELRAKGARIRHRPTNYRWAYEMQVEDLDGNARRLGSEPHEDQPIGEWLDMRGDVWVRSGDVWTRLEPG